MSDGGGAVTSSPDASGFPNSVTAIGRAGHRVTAGCVVVGLLVVLGSVD